MKRLPLLGHAVALVIVTHPNVFGIGAYWFESPAEAADDRRLRFQVNFGLPR